MEEYHSIFQKKMQLFSYYAKIYVIFHKICRKLLKKQKRRVIRRFFIFELVFSFDDIFRKLVQERQSAQRICQIKYLILLFFD